MQLNGQVSELERTRAIAVEDAAAALRRVERDLHDGAQVRLAAVAMNLGMAQEKAGDDALRELLDAAQAGVSGGPRSQRAARVAWRSSSPRSHRT